MNPFHKTGLLKRAAHAEKALLQAWTAVEQIFANKNSGTATTYEEYWEYLVSTLEKLEEGMKANVTRKVNIADTYYMDSYEPDNPYYAKATDLATFMGDRGDVDVIQNMLQCSQAIRNGKSRLKPKF